MKKTSGDGPSSFVLPATDAYGKTAKDFKAESSVGESTYTLQLSGSTNINLQTSVEVKFGKTSDGKAYIKSVNGAEYAGADVSVSLKVPVTRSQLNIKVVDALQQPKGAVCLKLVPFPSNTQHKTQQIISQKSTSAGMITKDISDLIPTGTTTEMWNVIATTASDSGADGANESSAQLKNIYVISVNGKGSAAPGIASWGVATKAGEKPSTMTEYGGQFTVTAITYALVTYKGCGKVSDQLLTAEVGATLAEPKTAAVSNYTLEGWYKDSSYKTKWDFSKDKVTADVTLYAKWSVDAETVYRLFNPYSGEHFFTKSAKERDELANVGWEKEGEAFTGPSVSSTKVYRLYNPYSSDHHYTRSEKEYNDLGEIGWQKEDVAWYSADESSGIRVYRLYNPYATVGSHHYTTSEKEYSDLGNVGWRQESIGWYALS